MDTFSMITGTTLNRYQLDIPSCTASLDVEEFSGAEKLSELYYYTITFTSAEKNIDAAQLLSKPAMLTMGGGALQQLADCKRVHGVITTFRRVNRSEDQSTYQITLQPFLFLLDKQFRSHRFFVNKSVPEVVEQVLQEHHLHDWEYEFNLKQHYSRREQINQYQESDLAFIQRLLAEVGIFYFFTLQEEAQSEVVHFADAQRALMFDKTLPVNSPSGMSDSGAESIWGLSITHNVVEANVTTDKHSALFRPGNNMDPRLGANGKLPRQDISSRVTGPILEHLHHNFAMAWEKETGQDLLTIRDSVSIAKKLKLRAVHGTPVMAQLLRTQAQAGKHDIETLYLQAVNNATQFIYIENQYFRWPPLAELINQVAERQSKVGRELHLFVVTNVTDEGIGAGTVNTQRMLEVLGRANIIPEVTKLRKIGQLSNATFGGSVGYIDPGDINKRNREMSEKIADFKKKADEIQSSEILPEERPGLKVHICSLVAPDSPPEEWVPVYIHSKLMIVNDVFTTHGSANINTRSMRVDSEMNIAHEWASVTRDLRRRLWNLHTNGRGGQDDAKDAFKAWEDLINANAKLQGTGKGRPEASLIKFYYSKPTLSDLD